MGHKTNDNSCMQGIANRTTDGDCGLLATIMNEFFLSVSDPLPLFNTNHNVSTVNGYLSDQYVISEFTTLEALDSFKVNKATGLTTFLHVC